MKLLRYDHRKCDPVSWDISTPELEAGAYLTLFRHLDEDYEVYVDIDENADQHALYKAAKAGDATAAKYLLNWRKEYEYEKFTIESLEQIPIDKVKKGFASGKKELQLIPKDLPDPTTKRTEEAWTSAPYDLGMARIYGPGLMEKISHALFDMIELREIAADPARRQHFWSRFDDVEWKFEHAERALDTVKEHLIAVKRAVPRPEGGRRR